MAAGDRASLNRKRRMRKNRTTEQNLKKGGATATAQVESQGRGVTPRFGAPAGPEEPLMRNDTGEPPATSSQAPAAAGNISCEATKTPDATSGADPAGKPADTHAEGACQGRGK